MLLYTGWGQGMSRHGGSTEWQGLVHTGQGSSAEAPQQPRGAAMAVWTSAGAKTTRSFYFLREAGIFPL